MKHFKTFFFSSVILLAAVFAFAFRPVSSQESKMGKPLTNYYFVYTGGGETTPSNYVKVDDLPEDCTTGDAMCAIIAPENQSTGHPVISSQLQARISQHNTSAGDVFLKP